MEKINIGPNVFTQAMPVTLLGTKIDDKVNFMTLAWVTRVNANPPLFAVAVNKIHHSNKGIRENKSFSINFPSVDMIVETVVWFQVEILINQTFLRFSTGN